MTSDRKFIQWFRRQQRLTEEERWGKAFLELGVVIYFFPKHREYHPLAEVIEESRMFLGFTGKNTWSTEIPICYFSNQVYAYRYHSGSYVFPLVPIPLVFKYIKCCHHPSSTHILKMATLQSLFFCRCKNIELYDNVVEICIQEKLRLWESTLCSFPLRLSSQFFLSSSDCKGVSKLFFCPILLWGL